MFENSRVRFHVQCHMTSDVNKPGKFRHSSRPHVSDKQCFDRMVTTKRCAFGTCKKDSRYPELWKRNPNGDPVKFAGGVRQNARRQKWIQACHRGDSFVCTKDSYILFSTFCRCKMGLTGLHDSYSSWHLYICGFLFGLSTFLLLHSCL